MKKHIQKNLLKLRKETRFFGILAMTLSSCHRQLRLAETAPELWVGVAKGPLTVIPSQLRLTLYHQKKQNASIYHLLQLQYEEVKSLVSTVESWKLLYTTQP